MPGKSDLSELLSGLQPRLNEGTYVFVSVADPEIVPRSVPIGTFKEAEGTTLILAQADADRLGLAYDFRAAWLTLTVHSALAAVGLTAAVARALAQHNISCNVIAGYYHDHLFVDVTHGPSALAVLRELQRSAANRNR